MRFIRNALTRSIVRSEVRILKREFKPIYIKINLDHIEKPIKQAPDISVEANKRYGHILSKTDTEIPIRSACIYRHTLTDQHYLVSLSNPAHHAQVIFYANRYLPWHAGYSRRDIDDFELIKQGFVTNKNRYIGREHARELVCQNETYLIECSKEIKEQRFLFSEFIWKLYQEHEKLRHLNFQSLRARLIALLT